MSDWRCAALVAGSVLVGAGCGWADAPGDRLVVAHRAAAGHWPENSRTAVVNAVAANYPAIEVDIVLTKDGVPVLAHDPWVSETLCTTADGASLSERVLIKDLTLDELRAGYRCGGVGDPATPDAAVIAEPVMTFDELIDEVRGIDVAVYLDLKQGEDTLGPEDFEREILSRWRAAGLSNRLFVEAGLEEAVRAFADEADVTTLVSWPRYTPGSSGVGQALATEFGHTLGVSDPVALVHALGADGFVSTYQTLKRRTAAAAQAEGVLVVLFTLNGERLLSRYCGWPVDLLITDYPERAPCL